MTTVKTKLRPSTVAGRPGSIIFLVTHHRVIRQITTGYKVFPHEWDEEHSKPVPVVGDERMETIRSITQRLRWDMEGLNKIIERFDSLRHSYSSDDVVAEFQRAVKEDAFSFLWRRSLSG